MFERWLSTMCFLAGVGFLVAAGYFYVVTPPPGPWLIVDQAEREISGCVAGEKRNVVFQLQNHSRRQMRVLGLARGCGLNSCFGPEMDADIPNELPAETSKLSLLLEIRRAGEFRSEATLWVDDGGTRGIELVVHGTAQAAPSKAPGKK